MCSLVMGKASKTPAGPAKSPLVSDMFDSRAARGVDCATDEPMLTIRAATAFMFT